MGRKLKRALWGSMGLVGATLAVGGFLHTKWGRPILARLGGCPAGGVVYPAADVQKVTFAAIKGNAGTTPAPSRPALGFKLDETSLDEVRAWVKEKNLTCEELKEHTVIRCANVPNAAMPLSLGGDTKIDELVLGFRINDNKLFTVDTFRVDQKAEDAQRQVSAISAYLKKELGKPEVESGTLELANIRDAVYVVRFKFSDTLVELNSIKIPSGISVRERYLSAKNPS